jgi:hypothetical protein
MVGFGRRSPIQLAARSRVGLYINPIARPVHSTLARKPTVARQRGQFAANFLLIGLAPLCKLADA